MLNSSLSMSWLNNFSASTINALYIPATRTTFPNIITFPFEIYCIYNIICSKFRTIRSCTNEGTMARTSFSVPIKTFTGTVFQDKPTAILVMWYVILFFALQSIYLVTIYIPWDSINAFWCNFCKTIFIDFTFWVFTRFIRPAECEEESLNIEETLSLLTFPLS